MCADTPDAGYVDVRCELIELGDVPAVCVLGRVS